MPRCRMQRHEHLPATPLMLTHVILDDRIAAGKAVFVPQSFKHLFGRVTLFAVPTFSIRRRSPLARHRRPVFSRADDGRPAGARDGSGSVIAGTGVVAQRLAREWNAAHPREP